MVELPPNLATKQAYQLMLAAEELLETAQAARTHNCSVLIDRKNLRFFLSSTAENGDLIISGTQDG